MKKFIRLIAVLTTAVLLTGTITAFAAPSIAIDDEWEVLRFTNFERIKEGLQPLSMFEKVQKASYVRAKELLELFSHTRPDGSACFTAVDEQEIEYLAVGENLNAGYTDAASSVEGWMNSEGHRKNILTADFSHLGVGYIEDKDEDNRPYRVQTFIGGCTVQSVAFDGIINKNESGELEYDKAMLVITCDMHGESYLPADNANPVEKDGTVTMTYAGKTVTAEVGKTYDANDKKEPELKPEPEPEPKPETEGFTDVKKNDWYYDYVMYATEKGIFQGTEKGVFSPKMTMTRAQLVQVFANISNVDTNTPVTKTGFSDVPANAWYAPAVKWAAENGIASGVGDRKFAPNTPVDREQMCTMLVNYIENFKKEKLSGTSAITPFADDKDISEWARYSVYACRRAELVDGTGGGNFTPKGKTDRASAATLFSEFHKEYIAK